MFFLFAQPCASIPGQSSSQMFCTILVIGAESWNALAASGAQAIRLQAHRERYGGKQIQIKRAKNNNFELEGHSSKCAGLSGVRSHPRASTPPD